MDYFLFGLMKIVWFVIRRNVKIIFRKKGFIQDIAQVNNIPQCTELPILGVTFQENCKYSEHVRAKLIKAN